MPTNPLEELDYKAGAGALSGERVFGNTVPATSTREQTFNTLWHGLRNLVKQEQISGDLTAADYATELTAGFVNMAKAIRRSARRLQASNIQTTTVNATPLTVTIPPDIFGVMLIDASPTPLAGESRIHPLSTANAQNKGRFIFVLNQTTAFRLVGHASSGRYARLAPGEGCWLYGVDDTGSGNTFWTPIGDLDDAPNAYHTFNAQWYNNADHAQKTDSFDMNYMRHGPGRRLMTINYPTSGVILTTAANVMLLASSDGFAATPTFLWPTQNLPGSGPYYAPFMPVLLTIGGVNEMGIVSCGDGNIYVQRMSGTFPTATQIYIGAASLTYITEHA